MQIPLIQDRLDEVSKIVKDQDIDYLAVYGSYARGEQTPKSDLDLLISFNGEKGLLELMKVQQQFSDLFGVNVDLITKNGISKYVKPYIQDDLQVIYAKKS